MLKVSIEEIRLKLLEDRVLLSDINFTLAANRIYTILGKNGSGKSTLLKSIPRLLDERFYSVKGKIFYHGENILALTEDKLLQLRKQKIKYVFQDAMNSFDHLKKFGYYFEKLSPGNIIDINMVNDLLKYFLLPGSDKLFRLYPYEVSGGMAQRISFVLTLISKPEVILLDEPTSGIDSAISNLFLLKLKEYVLQDNNMAILVTHDLKFAERAADEAAFLANGRLSGSISPSGFFKKNRNAEAKAFLNIYSQLS
ncbi:MAG: ATP-binding cassette domain-containing protein [Ignavibacteriaceae bacterium]